MLHKPYAFECISNEYADIQQSMEIKQEFAYEAMGELRRSIAMIYAPQMLDDKNIFAVMCVIVGLTTVDKLEVFLHRFLLFF